MNVSRKQLIVAGVLLILLNLLYLAGEAVFNSALLDLVAQGRVDPGALHRIELLGRSLAGVGVMLFVVGTWGPRLKAINGLLLIGVLAGSFAAVFFGQKWIVDTYAANTDWETRALAKSLLWLKTGLAEGYVELEGVPMAGETPALAEEKTFMALVGWLASASPAFLETAEAERENIIRLLSRRGARQALKSAYSEYMAQRKKIVDAYREYADAAEEYRLVRAGDPNAASAAWRRLNQRVIVGYDELMQGRKRFETRARREAKQHQHDFQRFFAKYTEPGCKQSCRKAMYRRHYVPKMKRAFGGDSVKPPEFWCLPRYDRTYFKSHGRNRYYFDSGALLEDFFDLFRDEKKPAYYDCSKAHTVAQMARRILFLNKHEYEEKTGYPFDLEDQAKYLEHPQTHRNARANLKQRGIAVSDDWTLDDAAEFRQAYMAYAKESVAERWRSMTEAEFGEVMPLSLSYREFIRYPAVQKKIRDAMGNHYVAGMDFEMSRAEFLDRIISPAFERRLSREVALLTRQTQKLGESGEHAQAGREAVRALVVPYVALFFSATVVMLTLVKTALLLLSGPLGCLPSAAQFIIKGVIVVAVVVMVPMSLSNSYTESKAFRFFMGETREQAPITWLTSAYLMRLQPALAPWGEQIRRHLGGTRSLQNWQSIRDRMAHAKQALAEDRLLTPRKDAAFTHYQAVLAELPYHPGARKGLQRIVDRYEELAAGSASPAIYHRRARTVEYALQSEQALPTLPEMNVLVFVLFGAILSVFVVLLIAFPKKSSKPEVAEY